MIEVDDKYLGHATAYAYAKAGGYTGTEEEFEELLGNIATDLAEIENLTVTVTTLPAGSSATASYSDGVLALGIPRGDKGETGTAATIAVGTVTTVAPIANAEVTNTGTSSAAVFTFKLPRGDGVATVTKTGTSGNVDTYTMTSDRGVVLGTFTVTNANVSSVNSKTGAVVLDAGDIGYNDSTTYSSGSTGEALKSLKSEITDLEDAVNDPTTGLNSKAPVIINNASGAIASFSDGADGMPVKKLVANIEPVQDLHGYENPWPAGGMGNLYPFMDKTATSLDCIATFKDNHVTLTGTSTSSGGRLNLNSGNFSLKAGTYYFKRFNVNLHSGVQCATYVQNGSSILSPINDGEFTLSEDSSSINIGLNVESERTYNYDFDIMIVSGSTEPTTFYPYSNICPITGHIGCNVTRTGINVWDETWESGVYDTTSGAKTSQSSYIRSKGMISCKENTQYYFLIPSSKTITVLFYGADGTYLGLSKRIQFNTSEVKTTPVGAAFMTFYINVTEYGNDISINHPSTDTSYHAYTGTTIPISWQTEAGTVYGGNLTINEDGTGTLVVDKYLYVYDGTEPFAKSGTALNGFYNSLSGDTRPHNWPKMINYGSGYEPGSLILDECSSMLIPTRNVNTYKENYGYVFFDSGQNFNVPPETFGTTVESFKAKLAELYAAGTPVSVFCRIAEPQTYTFTNLAQLTTLLGTNNIWADTGDVAVDYPADTKLFIEKLTQPTEDDMVANENITSGKFFMVGNNLYLSTAAILTGEQIIPGSNCTALPLADALNMINQ